VPNWHLRCTPGQQQEVASGRSHTDQWAIVAAVVVLVVAVIVWAYARR